MHTACLSCVHICGHYCQLSLQLQDRDAAVLAQWSWSETKVLSVAESNWWYTHHNGWIPQLLSDCSLCWHRQGRCMCSVMMLFQNSSIIVIRVYLSIQNWFHPIYISPIMARMLVQRGTKRAHKTRFFLRRSLLIWVGMAVPLHQGGKPPLLLESVSSSVERAVAALTHSSHKLNYFVHKRSSFF